MYKEKKILFMIIIPIVIIVIILALNKDKIFEKQDNILIYEEYGTISKENNFEYMTINEAIDFIENGTGVIYFGFPECKWCKAYLPILEEVANKNYGEKIYYCNIREDRNKNSKEYQNLVMKLSEYLYDDENGNKRIYVPDTYFIKNGNIQGHINDTSMITEGEVEEYYTAKVKEETITKIKNLLNILKDICDDTKGC